MKKKKPSLKQATTIGWNFIKSQWTQSLAAGSSWQLEVCCTTKLRNVSLLRENKFESLQYIQLESDFNGKLKAKAKLNFAKCLSHPSCLLISSAISFSFSCLLFSQLLTVLQVNVLSYPLFLSNFSYIFSLFHYYSWIPSALDEAGLSTSRNENQKHAKSFSICSFSQNVRTKIYDIDAMSQFISKQLHL